MDERELRQVMKELVAAQLVVEESTNQFAFRHALTREAAYSTLLRRERKQYHRIIAETTERDSADSLDAQVADLAHHYYEGEPWAKTLEYSRRAGEQAQAQYAPREAAEHFTWALQAGRRMSLAPPAQLHRARGKAHETLGDFEAARDDYTQALNASHDNGDRVTEWQSLIDLGFLWSGRDYVPAGEFFRRAVDLAQAVADPRLRAHSLNRLGNWLSNTGQAAAGMQAYRAALETLQAQGDKQGTAETHDLMGFGNIMVGDYVSAVSHYGQAVVLFRELGDPMGLASSLISRGSGASPDGDETIFSALGNLKDLEADLAEARRLARQIGAPAQQALVEIIAGGSLAAFGEFGAGLKAISEGLAIAAEIEHQQWIAAGYFVLGYFYLWMLESDLAIQKLTTALRLAQALHSAFLQAVSRPVWRWPVC